MAKTSVSFAGKVLRINDDLSNVHIFERNGYFYARYQLPGVKRDPQVSLTLKWSEESIKDVRRLAEELDEQLLTHSFDAKQWVRESIKDKLSYGTTASGLPVLRMPAFRGFIEEAFAIKAKRGDYKNPQETLEKKWKPLLNALEKYGTAVDNEWLVLFLNGQTKSQKQTFASVISQTIQVQALQRFGLDELQIQKAGRGYGKKDKEEMTIPTDEELLTYIDGITTPHWHWMAGMMFVYGLRDREVADCHFGTHPGDDDPLALDVRKSKTGRRIAYPLRGTEQWIKKLDLLNIKRPKNQKGQEYGYTKELVSAASQAMTSSKKDGRGYHRKPKLPFPLYTFRHAYALRGDDLGYNIVDMAASMGHSVRVHEETYKAHLDLKNQRKRGERMRQMLDQ